MFKSRALTFATSRSCCDANVARSQRAGLIDDRKAPRERQKADCLVTFRDREKQKAVRNIACAHGVKKIPLCELAHTSFRSVRVIHRRREKDAHAEKHTKDRGQSPVAPGPVAAGTGGTIDRRRDEETVVACPEDRWLGRQATARAKPIGFRPDRPNRSRSVTTNGVES
jgi:hypothetical protein